MVSGLMVLSGWFTKSIQIGQQSVWKSYGGWLNSKDNKNRKEKGKKGQMHTKRSYDKNTIYCTTYACIKDFFRGVFQISINMSRQMTTYQWKAHN